MEKDFLLWPVQTEQRLKQSRFRLDMKNYFMMRVVRHCNRLPRNIANAPSLEVFKVRLDRALSNLIS